MSKPTGSFFRTILIFVCLTTFGYAFLGACIVFSVTFFDEDARKASSGSVGVAALAYCIGSLRFGRTLEDVLGTSQRWEALSVRMKRRALKEIRVLHAQSSIMVVCFTLAAILSFYINTIPSGTLAVAIGGAVWSVGFTFLWQLIGNMRRLRVFYLLDTCSRKLDGKASRRNS